MVPTTFRLLFWLPYFTWKRLLHLGHHRLEQRRVPEQGLVVVGAEDGAVGDPDPAEAALAGEDGEARWRPSAAMRSSTAFCAPLPSATIVITAPTPMMMPSMVSTDRSLLARMDWKATAIVSPSSMAQRVPGAARRRRPARLLLLHAGQPAAAGDPVDPLPQLLLRLHQARARQDQHRIRFAGGRRRTSL